MRIFTRIMLAASLVGVAALAAPTTVAAQRSGVEIWSQTCGNCHTIQPAARYTAANWESIMVHMTLNARLTDSEAEAVLEFLKGGAKPLASAGKGQGAEVMGTYALADGITTQMVHQSAVDSAKAYQQQCVACHGKEGKGNGPAAAAFDPKPANFTDSTFQASRTDDQLVESITEGKNTMPGFGNQLTPEQIRALVVYIRKLGGQKTE